VSHLERGFVVPVWFLTYPGSWREGWATPNRRQVIHDEILPSSRGPYAMMPQWLRDRDPNRADGGDRPTH
jgi:hypothetical protein